MISHIKRICIIMPVLLYTHTSSAAVSCMVDTTTDSGTTYNGCKIYRTPARETSGGFVYTAGPGCYTNGYPTNKITCYGRTYYTTLASAKTAMSKCPYGSYTDTAGQSSCTLCPAGTFYPGNGATQCNYNCTGYAYTQTWETPTWASATSVNNICVAKTCTSDAYKNGSACVQCPTDAFGNVGQTTSSNFTGKTSCKFPSGNTYQGNHGRFTYTTDCSYTE